MNRGFEGDGGVVGGRDASRGRQHKLGWNMADPRYQLFFSLPIELLHLRQPTSSHCFITHCDVTLRCPASCGSVLSKGSNAPVTPPTSEWLLVKSGYIGYGVRWQSIERGFVMPAYSTPTDDEP